MSQFPNLKQLQEGRAGLKRWKGYKALMEGQRRAIAEIAQWAVGLIEDCPYRNEEFHSHPNLATNCPACGGRGVTPNRDGIERAARAVENEVKKWPVEDHPLGWRQRVPPPGASMQEVAQVAIAAFLFGDSTETRQEQV